MRDSRFCLMYLENVRLTSADGLHLSTVHAKVPITPK